MRLLCSIKVHILKRIFSQIYTAEQFEMHFQSSRYHCQHSCCWEYKKAESQQCICNVICTKNVGQIRPFLRVDWLLYGLALTEVIPDRKS